MGQATQSTIVEGRHKLSAKGEDSTSDDNALGCGNDGFSDTTDFVAEPPILSRREKRAPEHTDFPPLQRSGRFLLSCLQCW